jgi:hypothetical protein
MKLQKHIIVIFAGLVLLSACNFPLLRDAPQEDDPEELATIVAQTVQALNAQGDQPVIPAGTDQVSAGQPTITPLPTLTTAPIVGPPTQTPLPCNKPLFVSETIADDSEFLPGETFTKTWTFKNVGTCTWNTNYKMRFETGDQLGAPAEVAMPTSVAPDAQVTISVDMTAPTTPGTYQGYWSMYSDTDEYMGQTWVKIKTKDVLFQVTSVSYSMNSTNISMGCSGTVAVTGNITASRDGRVTYYWIPSEGVQSNTRSLDFDAAGTKSVTYDMAVDASKNYWVKLYIEKPNNQLFSQKDFTVTCN